MYPTTCPFCFNVFTTLSFWSGSILANTETFSTTALSSSSLNLSTSFPHKISELSIPTKLHIFEAAYGLSPVNIFVLTPIFFNLVNVFLTSFLGGSKNATNPINVIFFSSSTLKTFSPLYSLFEAKLITCIPWEANSFAFCSTISIISLVISINFPLYLTCVQTFKISSRAPFVNIL